MQKGRPGGRLVLANIGKVSNCVDLCVMYDFWLRLNEVDVLEVVAEFVRFSLYAD
jgi:hypothetical protein